MNIPMLPPTGIKEIIRYGIERACRDFLAEFTESHGQVVALKGVIEKGDSEADEKRICG